MVSPSSNDNGGISGSQHQQNTSPRTSSYKGRVRTGCLVCRSRKVKCDETRPSCQKCSRLNKTCVYRIPQTWAVGSHPANVDCQQEQPGSRDGGDSTAENGGYAAHEQLFLLEPGSGSSPGPGSGSGVLDALEIDSSIEQPDRHLQAAAAAAATQHVSPNQRSLGQAHVVRVSEYSSDRFQETSQLIYLSTSLDWLAASQVPTTSSFSYFIQEVDSPFLSPFDYLNWTRIKNYIIHLGVQHDTVSKSILAVQVLHRAQVDRLPMDHAMSVYRAAISSFESTLSNDAGEFRIVLVVAFLLCLAQATLPNDDGSTFSVLDGAFTTRLETWLLNGHPSPVALRLCAWIRCLNTSTKRPGSAGLLSPPLSMLLYHHIRTVPSLSELDRDAHPENSLYDVVSAPLFAFYLEVQLISNRVADVTHYRRSRTTPEDQAEVTDILAAVEADMDHLWENRPAHLRLRPEELRQHFSAQIARPIIALAGLCIAAFQTEVVTIGRIRGDPPYPSPRSKQALAQIRGIVEGDWNVFDADNTLNPGYLRPIFMYALESFHQDDTQWAADHLRQIQDPISRSRFLASFVEAHGQEQRSQGRRITMKYFCYQTFGVPLPFM